MLVTEIMTPAPVVVTGDEPLLHAAELMRDHDVGIVPVVEDRGTMKPIGVITDRDITIRHVAVAHHHDCPATAVMTGGRLDCVQPTDDVQAVLQAMKRDAVHRVLVTDRRGRLIGIVATADLLRHAQEIGRDRIDEVLEALAEPVALPR
jgi:CBS domain-containing protein